MVNFRNGLPQTQLFQFPGLDVYLTLQIERGEDQQNDHLNRTILMVLVRTSSSVIRSFALDSCCPSCGRQMYSVSHSHKQLVSFSPNPPRSLRRGQSYARSNLLRLLTHYNQEHLAPRGKSVRLYIPLRGSLSVAHRHQHPADRT